MNHFIIYKPTTPLASLPDRGNMILRFFQDPPTMTWPGLVLMALLFAAMLYQCHRVHKIEEATVGLRPLGWQEVTPAAVHILTVLGVCLAAYDLTRIHSRLGRLVYPNAETAVVIVATCAGLLLLAACILARQSDTTLAWFTATLAMYSLAIGCEYGRMSHAWQYNWNYWISGAIVLAVVSLIGAIYSWLNNKFRPWRRRRSQIRSVPSV